MKALLLSPVWWNGWSDIARAREKSCFNFRLPLSDVPEGQAMTLFMTSGYNETTLAGCLHMMTHYYILVMQLCQQVVYGDSVAQIYQGAFLHYEKLLSTRSKSVRNWPKNARKNVLQTFICGQLYWVKWRLESIMSTASKSDKSFSSVENLLLFTTQGSDVTFVLILCLQIS